MKESYNDVRGKFRSLPSFASLNSELEISSVDKPHFILRDILRKIADTVHDVKSILRPALEPDAYLSSGLYEHSCFSSKQHEKLFELFKKLSALERDAQHALLTRSENAEANAVIRTFKEWKKLRKASLPFIECMREGWRNGRTIPHHKGDYFG